MLAPVKVVNPRVMAEQYPNKDQRQKKKQARRKITSKTKKPTPHDNVRIDITA